MRFAATAAWIALALMTPALAEPITGRVSVVDGDTLDMQGMPIRLYGIDAPESRQPCQNAEGRDYRCGKDAAFALADKIGQAPVSCEIRQFDRYGRVIGACSLGGEDLNGWMVAQGHAVAYRKYSKIYVEAEERARAEKRGVWAGSLMMPWDWRHRPRD